MNPISSDGAGGAGAGKVSEDRMGIEAGWVAAGGRRRGRLNLAIRESLRDVGVQLSLLNHRVSGHLDLKGSDLECLDLVDKFGPISPSALARRTGMHPATMTGVVDRLVRGGWITRERDPSDRRGVVLASLPSRRAEVLRLVAGMGTRMARICGDYSDAELELIEGFLRRTADAGRAAAEDLDAS
jgi:DNA-binding MarR family transcriptional regulator